MAAPRRGSETHHINQHEQRRERIRPGTLAPGAYQLGIVVPDIHKGMAFFKDKIGVPEFLFIEKPELQDETYLG